jgi:hypothetical protein
VDERFVAGLRAGQRATVFGRGLGDREYRGGIILVKSIMGKKTVFSRSATERKDLDVVQVLIELPLGFAAPIGLEVDVKIQGFPFEQTPGVSSFPSMNEQHAESRGSDEYVLQAPLNAA